VLSLILLPLIFGAPLFWSFERAPHFLQVLSVFNPLRYHVEFIHALAVGTPLSAAAVLVTLLSVPAALVLLGYAGHRAEWLSQEVS